jgi:CheY-like chemotaxis protein
MARSRGIPQWVPKPLGSCMWISKLVAKNLLLTGIVAISRRVFLPLISVKAKKRCNLCKLAGFTEVMRIPRVLLADDHPKMLEQIAQLLARESEIVGAVENGEQLIAAALSLDPDVIVLDISMPVLNGIEAARYLQKSRSRAKVIILTMQEDDAFVAAAVLAGALGYVLKRRISIDLIPAIRQVLQGQVFVSPPLRAH